MSSTQKRGQIPHLARMDESPYAPTEDVSFEDHPEFHDVSQALEEELLLATQTFNAAVTQLNELKASVEDVGVTRATMLSLESAYPGSVTDHAAMGMFMDEPMPEFQSVAMESFARAFKKALGKLRQATLKALKKFFKVINDVFQELMKKFRRTMEDDEQELSERDVSDAIKGATEEAPYGRETEMRSDAEEFVRNPELYDSLAYNYVKLIRVLEGMGIKETMMDLAENAAWAVNIVEVDAYTMFESVKQGQSSGGVPGASKELIDRAFQDLYGHERMDKIKLILAHLGLERMDLTPPLSLEDQRKYVHRLREHCREARKIIRESSYDRKTSKEHFAIDPEWHTKTFFIGEVFDSLQSLERSQKTVQRKLADALEAVERIFETSADKLEGGDTSADEFRQMTELVSALHRQSLAKVDLIMLSIIALRYSVGAVSAFQRSQLKTIKRIDEFERAHMGRYKDKVKQYPTYDPEFTVTVSGESMGVDPEHRLGRYLK